MNLKVKQLRKIVAEAIGMSQGYAAKEAIREKMQAIINSEIAAGRIIDDASLAEFVKNVSIALSALKMVPFTVWQNTIKR